MHKDSLGRVSCSEKIECRNSGTAGHSILLLCSIWMQEMSGTGRERTDKRSTVHDLQGELAIGMQRQGHMFRAKYVDPAGAWNAAAVNSGTLDRIANRSESMDACCHQKHTVERSKSTFASPCAIFPPLIQNCRTDPKSLMHNNMRHFASRQMLVLGVM